MSRKYKDINKVHALLEGEGWHIIESKSHKTNRRDKRRCIYYNAKFKSCKLNCICNGSSNCSKYKEHY